MSVDILALLPPLRWRGIEVPCQDNKMDFTHGQVDHEQHGVDGAYVEPTGRKASMHSYRIPFLVGLDGWPTLYPTLYRDFYNACLDGSTGPLELPEEGEIDANLVSFSKTVSTGVRNGYFVDVVWKENNEAGITIGDDSIGPIAEAVALAAVVEPAAGEITPPLEYDDGAGNSLLKSLKQIQGSIALAQMSVQDTIASIDNVINGINDMIDAANSAVDPEAWGIVDGLKQIEASCQETKNRLAPEQKAIQFVIATASILVAEAAAKAGMALDAFIQLNPRAAAKRTIKAGQEYFVYV